MIVTKNIPKKAGIYKFINKINQKVYIGKSVNLYNRIISHKNHKARYVFDRALRKYGWGNFDLEIIHYYEVNPVDTNELIALEAACIYEYNSLINKNGYNICLFGNENSGIKRTKEMKLRYSLSKIGNNNGRFDYTIYTFKNRITNEVFTGYKYDFYKRFNLCKSNIYGLIKGKEKSVKDWIFVN